MRIVRYGCAAVCLAALGAVRPAAAQVELRKLSKGSMTDSQHAGYVGVEYLVSVKKLPGGGFAPGHPKVGRVDAGSPAAKAGLLAGDEIVALNGTDTRTKPMGNFAAGVKNVLRVRRGNEEREVVLIADPPHPRPR